MWGWRRQRWVNKWEFDLLQHTKKKESQAVHRPSNSIELFQYCFFVFHFRHVSTFFPPTQMTYWMKISSSSQSRNFISWQQEKNEHRMEKNVSHQQFRNIEFIFFLLMSRRTQNKKKQVKLNIEDLISQSLSYVIAPSTRGDGRENEIPPIGYFAAANILVVIELTMLCVWSTMCHVCVLSSGG